jgi:hypothetical protein
MAAMAGVAVLRLPISMNLPGFLTDHNWKTSQAKLAKFPQGY